MQTFVPFPSFRRSAECLDRARLGKQRVEAWQILNTLRGLSDGWQHHPAVRMWKGAESGLALYGVVVCQVWIERGYRDTFRSRFIETRLASGVIVLPPWWGDAVVHASHANALVRKDPAHYRPYFPDADPTQPYYWPVPQWRMGQGPTIMAPEWADGEISGKNDADDL